MIRNRIYTVFGKHPALKQQLQIFIMDHESVV